ncbi:MAG: alpha/beta hydrolase [Gammaproteobacteria bacterium]
MRKFVFGLFRLITRLIFGALVIVLTIMLIRAFDARRQPDLEPWHTARFENDFRVSNGAGADWQQFLRVEDLVFEELETGVVRDRGDDPSRYNSRSRFYPGGFEQNWNRSFELAPADPWAAIVLVHGLTDSPYSVRAAAEIFRDLGVYVVAPRMPGHGLAPAALIEITRHDWMEAVRVAIRHARSVIGPDAPLLVGGYSNGGALVTKYTLDSLEDDALETPDQVYLFSPAIGITAFARLASWHMLLASVPYFEKFRWESILPEFDPYKYNSFPKIAGHESWMLAGEIRQQAERLQGNGALNGMPPILCFQSLADATVLTEAIVTHLFDRLTVPNSELVLFDVNRSDRLGEFLSPAYPAMLDRLMSKSTEVYALTVVSNAQVESGEVVARTRFPGGGDTGDQPLGHHWPPQIYSMSHVAIPFPQDDPWYGAGDGTRPTLGNINPKGEKRVLRVPLGQFARLRYNPFFPYIKARIESFAAPLNRGATLPNPSASAASGGL